MAYYPEPPIDPPDYDVPECPVCGAECDTIYTSMNGEVLGCNECINSKDAYDYMEERKEALKYGDY